MANKSSLFISSVCGLALFSVGAYRIFTNNLEAMSLVVAYIFLICGLTGFILNVVKLSRLKRS